MRKHYKIAIIFYALAVLSALVAIATGESFTAAAMYGLFGLAETIRKTSILLRRYRAAMKEEEKNEAAHKFAV